MDTNRNQKLFDLLDSVVEYAGYTLTTVPVMAGTKTPGEGVGRETSLMLFSMQLAFALIEMGCSEDIDTLLEIIAYAKSESDLSGTVVYLPQNPGVKSSCLGGA